MKMRPWNTYDAYLFDIDGTLLNCQDAVHYFAFCEALTSAAGKSLNLDGIVAHGNTDVGILRDAFTLNNIDDAQWRPSLQAILADMCSFVESRRHELCVNALPGAQRVLEHLRNRGAVLGIATGNLKRIGWLKLERCALHSYFDFGGFSDEFEYRTDVFRAALAQARALTNQNASVCVVGDTPADIRAAKENSLDVIAVASGIYNIEELQQEKPDLCVRSLEQLMAGGSADAA
jgi:phosphoglycolate phosphatase-like HAD superfamily hydrolase